MIVGRDLMVQLGLMANFKRQVLQWGDATVHMKEPIRLLEQYDITKCEMLKVRMHIAEPDSAREATEWMVKILDSTYVKADLKQVANNTSQLNS